MGIAEHGALPEVLAQVRSDRSATVVFNGGTYELQGQDGSDIRAQALHYITGLAAQIVGGPVQVALTDPDGSGWRLVVTPAGEVIDEAPTSGGIAMTSTSGGEPPQHAASQEAAPDDVAPHNTAPTALSPDSEHPLEHTLPGSDRAAQEHVDPAASPFAPPDSRAPDQDPGSAPHVAAANDHPPVPPAPVAPAAGASSQPQAPAEFAPGSVAHAFRPQYGAQAQPAHPGAAAQHAPPQYQQQDQYPQQVAVGQEGHPGHAYPDPHPEHPGYPGHADPAAHHGYPGHAEPASHPGFPGHAPMQSAPGQPGMAPAPGHPDIAPAPGHPGTPPVPGQPGPDQQGPRRRDLRESFLRTEQAEAPATQGMRGALSRIGIRTSPSAAERAERADINAVSQHWPGVRTIAVVNGKGGANKTPTTALLAAIFARNSGSATLAWDNNETRGTLGWRTEQGKHDATVQDLLPQGQSLLDPAAKAGDISHFVHHQAADKYDVLRSNPNVLSAEQRIDGDDVDLVHDVAGRYYRLIFIDSGNDESADHWLRMIDKADQLVVATIAKPEHAEAGALLLEALAQRDEHSAQLARGAVVVISQAREKDTNPSAQQIADGFTGWVREVVTIPYDRAMVESVLRFDSLDTDTKRAWLRAGAAVATGL